MHRITLPTVNGVAAADQPMTVRWSVPTRAKAVEIETRDFESAAMPDTGAYAIPAIDNPATKSQRVRVYRFNETDMAGDLLGSRLRVTVRHTVEPVRVQ